MFKSILVPIDIAQRSSWEGALPQAIELARASGSKVTVMTVVRDVKAMLEGGWCSGTWMKGSLDWLSRIELTPW